MAKTIHERYKKWVIKNTSLTSEALEFFKPVYEGKVNCNIWAFLDALSAERERGFEAGYMSALKHIGGKKK
ncbi:MAG: hypothetical protein K2J08_01760 [Ruminococcus sp.]|nr:hypothetical protein [Ruminococcus sp.]